MAEIGPLGKAEQRLILRTFVTDQCPPDELGTPSDGARCRGFYGADRSATAREGIL